MRKFLARRRFLRLFGLFAVASVAGPAAAAPDSKRFMSFEEAKQKLREYGIGSAYEYRSQYASKGWMSWKDFQGGQS